MPLKDYSVLCNKRTIALIFWGKNSGATALFEGGTLNKNLMVILRTIFVLKDILYRIQF